MKPFYFGCWGGPGHHMYGVGGEWVPAAERPRTARHPDAGYTPDNEQQLQGAARLTHEDGRTILAFWDRTEDHRRGSHSTFLLPGLLDFAAAVAAARAAFPEIWRRLDAAGVVVRPA